MENKDKLKEASKKLNKYFTVFVVSFIAGMFIGESKLGLIVNVITLISLGALIIKGIEYSRLKKSLGSVTESKVGEKK